MDDLQRAQRRAQADLRLLALLPSQQNHLAHPRHRQLQGRLGEAGLELRVVAQVDRGRLGRTAAKGRQLLVEMVRQKGREGRHQAAELLQHPVQGGEGGDLVGGDVLSPKPAAIEADVPVGELLNELEQPRHHVVEAVGVHLLGDAGLQGLQAGENPLVEDVVAQMAAPFRRPAVDFRVGLEEHEGVAPRQQRPPRHVPHPRVGEALLLRPHQAGIDEVQAQGVGAVGLHQFVRRRVVAQPLGHLLAVRSHHHAVDDDVAESRLVVEGRGQHCQGVEPAAGLVQALGDELRREAGLEHLLVLERIVQLGVGHGAGLEPAVQHLRDASVNPVLPVDGEGQRVHMLPMQIGHPHAGAGLQLVNRTDAEPLPRSVVDPHRDGGAPHPVSGDGPVGCALQPVAEAPVLDVLRHPAHLLVVGHQAIDDFGDPNVPAWHRPVDQRRVRAVAIGIGVLNHLLAVQQAALLQVPDDGPVRLLDVLAGEVPHLFGETAAHGHRADEGGDARLPQHPLVVLAEGRRLMHQPGALIGGDIVIGHYDEGAAVALRGEIGERRLIGAAHQVRPAQPRLDLQIAVGGQPLLGKVDVAAKLRIPSLDIGDVRADADR